MSVRSVVCGIALAVAGVLSLAQAKNAPPWTDTLSRQAMATGFQAKLPPNLSRMLGLTKKSESIGVRQLASRAGQKVHTFNVVLANKGDIVVFVVDEKEQSTVAYLLDSRGKLRGAVSYQTGAEPQDLSDTDARSGLAREIRYWSDYAPAASAAKPSGARHPANAPKPVGAPEPADVPKPAVTPKPADSPKPPGGATSP